MKDFPIFWCLILCSVGVSAPRAFARAPSPDEEKLSEEPVPELPFIRGEDWQLESVESASLIISDARQTSTGLAATIQVESTCSVSAKYGLFRRLYTAVLPCVLEENGDLHLRMDRNSVFDDDTVATLHSRRTTRDFDLWHGYNNLDGSISAFDVSGKTDLGDRFIEGDTSGSWGGTRYISDRRSETSKFTTELHARFSSETQAEILNRLLKTGRSPKTLVMEIKRQIRTVWVKPWTPTPRTPEAAPPAFTGWASGSTSIPFALDSWKSGLCDGFQRVASTQPASDPAFNLDGWTSAMRLARASTCPAGTANSFQATQCARAARTLVDKYVLNDFTKLRRAADELCDAKVVQREIQTNAADRLRTLLIANNDDTARMLKTAMIKANLPEWDRAAQSIETEIGKARARDRFKHALSVCESDATQPNCDEALRLATDATPEDRQRISAAREKRTRSDAELATQRARAQQIAVKNAEAELAWLSRKRMSCEDLDIYVGREMCARAFWPGVNVCVETGTITGVGKYSVTYVNNETGDVDQSNCDELFLFR